MGQHGSCIQGQPDWLGPYVKASSKRAETDDIYEQIRKLAESSSIKDMYELENLFRNQVASTKSKRSSTLSSKTSNCSSTLSGKESPDKFEQLIYKEYQCKDVNFINEDKENKVPIAKPAIVEKTGCAVHGHKQALDNQNQRTSTPQPCRVHGHRNGQEKFNLETKKVLQAKQNMLPEYRHPPKVSLPEIRIEKPHFSDTESLDDDDSMNGDNAFTCPEFLKNLILPTNEPETEDLLAAVGVQSAKETIQRLEDRAESIVETFGVVLKHLEYGDWSTFCISTSRLCDDIRRVMKDYNIQTESKDLDAIKIRNHITGAMNQLTMSILSSNQNSDSETTQNILIPAFKNLGEVLHEMMEFLICKELKVLVDCIHNGTNSFCTRMAVCAVAEMSLSGELMCRLIVKESAILPLLNLCKIRKYYYLRPLALRILTVICSVKKALEEFEKLSGFDVIMSILREEPEEKVMCETVGLVAQILKQWTELNHSLAQKTGHHLNQLVKYLAATAKKALSPEMFLLSAACLATLSCCSANATTWIQDHAEEMRLLASNTKQESYV